MSPAVASDAAVCVGNATDSAVYAAKASDALANSPIVKQVTLSKNPIGYWRLDDPAGNGGAAIITANPSFEAGNLTSWNATGGVVAANDFAEDGVWSARITGAVGYNHIHQRPTLGIGTYKFTAWIKTDTFTHSTGAGLQVEGQPNAGATIAIRSGGLAVPAGTADWTLYTLVFEVLVAGTVNLLGTNAYGGTSTGTIWFDNLACVTADIARDSSGSLTQDGAVFFSGVAQGLLGLLPGDPNDAAMTFDGASGSVLIPAANLGLAGSFGVSMWVLPTLLNHAGGGSNATPIEKPNPAGSNYRVFISTGGAITFRINGLSTTDFATAAGAIQVGVLAHIACTWDGSKKRIYVNNVLVATSGVLTGAIGTNTNGMFIGRAVIATRFWDGPIKEVAVFNYALSAADVSDLFLAGKNALGALAAPQDAAV